MNFKNINNAKYFLFLIFLIFNSFSVSTSIGVDYSAKPSTDIVDVEEPILKYPSSMTEKVFKKLDSIFTRVNKRQDFNGSVLVAKNGKIVFSNEYGYANFRKKIKLDKDFSFQLASVSKQFTATAILILQEKGLIELDDFVTKYFPDFPYEEITVKQLLNHTSGLPKYFWLAEHKWKKEKPPVNSEMMSMMSEHKLNLFFKPGSRFDYSNTGYFVLASLVEKISGMEYGDFLETNIFKPLHMDNSFVYRFEEDSIQEKQLDGFRLYRRRWHGKVSGTVNDAIVGDKNVYSTTEDMLKWINGLNSLKIISKESLDQMYTKGETRYGKKVPYGYGFRINDKEEKEIIYHNGKWNGFTTSVMQYKEDDIVVITLEHSNFNYNSMKLLNTKVKSIVDNNFDSSLQ